MTKYTRQKELVVRKDAMGGPFVRASAPAVVSPRAEVPAVEPAAEISRESSPRPHAQPIASSGQDSNAICNLFLLSLLIPLVIRLGPLVLLPYRIVLLAVFVPLFIKLVSGAIGRTVAADWLVLGAALWTALAMAANHPLGQVIEPVGINVLEFFGAYLVGRVAIRSAEAFIRMVKILFWILVVLVPFGIVEFVADRNIILSVIPSSLPDGNQGIRFGFNRVQGPFSHAIHYGVFASAILGLAWYAFNPLVSHFRYWLTVPIVGFSTVMSLSTGALIAFNVQVILIAWEMITKPNPKRWAIFGWLSAAGYIIVDILAERTPFHTIVFRLALTTESAYTRILIFEHGMNNVRDNPIFGLGMNDWVRPSYLGASTDNFWLLVAMRYGVPSFALLALAVFVIIRQSSRVPLTDPKDRACRAAFLTTIGGLIIAGGTVDYWKAMLAFFMFLLGSGVWTFTGGARSAPSVGEEAAEEDADSEKTRRSSPSQRPRGQARRV